MAGCNVVSTDRGYARDYLQAYALYCDPSNPISIRNAVVAAYESPYRSGLAAHIRDELDFEKMIDRFSDIYRELL